MLVVIPCHEGDQDQALRLLNWIAELGQVQASAMLFCSSDCDINTLMAAGRKAFVSIRHERDAENFKCNWQSNDPGPRDPTGPNSVFRQVAWAVYLKDKKPWLFLEPDSIPLAPDWYSKLVAEYQGGLAAGKIVMGDMVSTNSPHLSGVAVYPPNVPEVFPKMVHQVEGAFDTSSAKTVLANAHITPLIMDRWRSPSFSADTFSKIKPEAVLFHADKSGSLIPLLRHKLGMDGGDISCAALLPAKIGSAPVIEIPEEQLQIRTQSAQSTAASSGAAKSDPSSAPVVDIYLKTYPKDYELANYCLKSIAKFVTGWRNCIIECPDPEGIANFIPFNFSDRTIKSDDRQPGYIDQQAKKLAAFKHTDAEYLLYIDSDCCFQRPFDVSEMFRDGKSTWQYTHLHNARSDQKSAWIPVMEKFLGKLPGNEFMRRHPHILPRWLPEEMDKFCRYRHGKSLDEYIMAQGDPNNPLKLSFSEFNCAGFFAWEFFRDRFSWVTDAEATIAPVYQGFTHGGESRKREDIERYEKILGWVDPAKLARHKEIQDEIQKEREIERIEDALYYLGEEARKSPLHKARLMKRITAALAGEKKPQASKRRRNLTAKKPSRWYNSDPEKGVVGWYDKTGCIGKLNGPPKNHKSVTA